jgi:hypothetical protein
MSLVPLELLDQKRIAVGLDVSGRHVLLKGVGTLYEDPALGVCLKIGVHDALGDFDVILRESEWNGEVLSEPVPDCDYLISLAGEGQPVGSKS